MWELNYNIHDLLTIKIRGNGFPDATKHLRYSYFQTDENIDNPDISLNIDKFIPSNEGATSIAHKYWVKDNYFYCKEKGSRAKWEIEIFGFETGNTVINFHGRNPGVKGLFFPTFMAQEFLIPFIEYKLAKKNCYFIHGGAVCKDDYGYVFTGRPGVWKTSLIMDLLRTNEYQFLGDDRIILRDDGSILCFPTSLFLFDYTLANTKTEQRSMSNNLNLVYRILMNRKEQSPKNLIKKCLMEKIVFISRFIDQNVQIHKIPPNEGLQKIIVNNMAEYIESTKKSPVGQFFTYVNIYSLIYPDTDLLSHHYHMEEQLSRFFSSIPLHTVTLPFRYDRSAFDFLANHIQEE